MDNFSLHAATFSVNYAHDRKAFPVRFAQVFFDDRLNLTRRNRVQIEDIRDFDLDRFRKWRGVVTVHIQEVLGVLTSFKSVPSGST